MQKVYSATINSLEYIISIQEILVVLGFTKEGQIKEQRAGQGQYYGRQRKCVFFIVEVDVGFIFLFCVIMSKILL